MADFVQKRQYKSREPLIQVDAGLAPGVYTFQLEVTDNSGNVSKPARVRVEIVRALIDGPVIRIPTGIDRLTPVTRVGSTRNNPIRRGNG